MEKRSDKSQIIKLHTIGSWYNDFMEMKNSDFGYGNEIPQFLEFLNSKQSYWNILSKKILNNETKRPTITDYISAHQQRNKSKKQKKWSLTKGLFPKSGNRRRMHSSLNQGKKVFNLHNLFNILTSGRIHNL